MSTFDSIQEFALRVLDFAIVFLVIYQLLLLIRGTRAMQMLIGLLGIIVVFFVSGDNVLGLQTLNWLLDKFMASFFLVLVVLFQKDIRLGLLKFTNTRFLMGLKPAEQTHIIQELVKAAEQLSNASIGALIVLERNADLSPYTEEGIAVDAQVTDELLFAIFNPANANPLHDGATIIRNGRVSAAGCFLPLTSNPRVDQTLGTRHRAAIGLSEDSDAVVLVVSEETGTVSVCLNGQIRRGLDSNQLRELLQHELALRGAGGGDKRAEARS
ncbi:MAG: TIGR00159 family protein [Deltaproteobacteria bacterium]|nr:MAG: TIGR00159 family protein [Deltaproteobacteria bacterium]